MRRPPLVLALGSLALIVLVAPVRTRAQNASSDDLAAIRATLDAYLQGQATGDGARFAEAFHPVANLYWMRADTLAQRTGGALRRRGFRPAPDEAARRRRIVFLDVVGTAGVAKVELDYPAVTFVDYLSLLKIDGARWIVAKTFNVALKAAR